MTQTQTKPCRNRCGNTVEVEIPDVEKASLREALERWPLLCDECADKVESEDEAREEEKRREKYLERVRSSGIGRDLIGVTFDVLEDRDQQRAALPDVKRWADGDLRGLLLGGPVGVGKSYLAAAATNVRLLREPLDWITVPRLMVQARAGFNDPAREQVTKLLMQGTRTLVLDDIDKVKPTEFAIDVLFEAVESRRSNGAALLVTTNMHYPDLVDQIGEPIASRLAGYCTSHFIEGKDLRAAA